MPSSEKQQAVIIGSGIAGIACSIRLAVKGYQVAVYEKNSFPGGKLHQIQLGDFRFDAGPSLFTMPHLVDELFTLADKDPKNHFRYSRLNTVCKYFYEDGLVFEAVPEKETFAAQAAKAFGVDSSLILKKLEHSEKLLNLTGKLFLEQSLHVPSNYFSKDVLQTLANICSLDLTKTMHEANLKSLKEPRLVQLFDRYATYNGSNPYKAPGVLNIIPALEHGQGAFLPEKGMHAITESLVNLAEELGVNFYYNSPVERIEYHKTIVKGIRVNGQLVPAEIVISNADIVPTYRKLLPELPAPERTLKQERSSSALIFYWGMNSKFDELDVHNIFFSRDYEHEFNCIFNRKELSEDPTVYINITSDKVKGDAPENGQNWFVMINVPHHDGTSWDDRVAISKERIIAKLERVLGKPVANHIACEETLTPEKIEQQTSSYLGALYGAASNNRFAAFLRHANFTSRIKNLYFCGGSVHPGGGIPLCLLSAKIVDELIGKTK